MRRLQQVGVLALGLLVAAIMVALGWWQVQVFQTQGIEASRQRAAEAPVPLESVAVAGAAVQDGYGRTVAATGTYLRDQQLLVPQPGSADTFRVLSALQLPDGSVLPVVRGVVRGNASSVALPPAPAGSLAQQGVLLPSEEAAATELTAAGQLGAVRIPALTQVWAQPMVDGFLVLAGPYAEAQRLEPAPLDLPESEGRFRNGAYAIQWWIFAAFAVVMAAKIAKDLGDRGPGGLTIGARDSLVG